MAGAGPGDRGITGALRVHAVLVYAFLYLPILVVVVFAFNDSRLVQVWHGFSLRWFGEAWRDEGLRHGLLISFYTALFNALLATSLGTSAAIGLRNVGARTRATFDAFMYMTLITPELVAAIASLMAFVTIGLPLGPVAIVITHSIFNTAVVTLIVRARLSGMDRSLEEAARDLGASRWSTFREVTLPQIFPAVVAGTLLAFTFSFDDVVLSTFVSGPGSTTLPVAIFSELRFGLSPKINVVAVFTLTITLTAIVVSQILLRRSSPRTGRPEVTDA
ncbi:MAG: spermidine/putrescine transport system permease protein [Actinomycetota bacterium]|jgi:spermidine/putrescine transport system permease protein|nr:spermidine/putrescine transport system permease protein [Actinomycetota bacterium]